MLPLNDFIYNIYKELVIKSGLHFVGNLLGCDLKVQHDEKTVDDLNAHRRTWL